MIEPIKISTSEPDNELDFNKIALDTFINVNEKIERQPVALSIGTNIYKNSEYPTPISSYGDFFCLVGASKSRKSFAKKAIISRYIGGTSDRFFPDVKGHGSEGKAVIDNDTEQSRYHVQRGARQVLEMCGFIYPNYHPYGMRPLDYKQRLGLIEWQLKNIENIGLMFIDGVADLVKNANDLDECNELVQKLMTWSADYNISIGTVLHVNHGSDKATGHLGSAITKKAESVIYVKTEDGLTSLEPFYTRNIPFNEIRFEIDPNGLPAQFTPMTNENY
jgi:hypothetical protein